MSHEKLDKIRTARGFVAALDQSGGSTPKALRLYGARRERVRDEAEMFDLIHEMRTPDHDAARPSRASGSSARSSSSRRWTARSTARAPPSTCGRSRASCPFLKVDKGLADEADGARCMKPMPGLDALLARAKATASSAPRCAPSSSSPNRPAWTRSSRSSSSWRGQILDAGLVPIIEPEVDIHSPEKARGGGAAQGAPCAALDALGPRAARHAQADAARGGRLLRRPRRAPARAAGRRAVRRLHAGGRERHARPQPRRRRELLARAHRGAARRSRARPSSTRRSTPRSRASTRRRSPDCEAGHSGGPAPTRQAPAYARIRA